MYNNNYNNNSKGFRVLFPGKLDKHIQYIAKKDNKIKYIKYIDFTHAIAYSEDYATIKLQIHTHIHTHRHASITSTAFTFATLVQP